MDFEKEIKNGRFSSIYFHKSKQVAKRFHNDKKITVQYFQRKDNVVLCGVNEIVKFLKKLFCGRKDIKIWSAKDGDLINKNEIVLLIEGPFHEFVMYENIFDGYLSRQTSIATNANLVVKAANNKKVIYMGDRADDYRLLKDDGYAAHVGGLSTQTVPDQVERHSGKAIGTIPHALIQFFEGDLVATLKAYNEVYPNEPLSALVDFNNNVISESLKIAKVFGKKLALLRVDTSPNMVDHYFDNLSKKEYGVNHTLIKALRDALDNGGHNHVKIVASSGINPEKIAAFEAKKTPIDIYGVGQYLLQIRNHFTCDSVKVNGKLIAKEGRKFDSTKNLKLKKVVL